MRNLVRITIITVCCLGTFAPGEAAQLQLPAHRPSRKPLTTEENNLPMQVPVLGFVYEPENGGVRAIRGIPGSAVLGDRQSLPAEVTNVHFAPGQMYALVERGDSGPTALIDFASGGPGAVVEIPGVVSKPDIISFSPSANAAAIYSSSEGRLQVITGLPDAPQVGQEISLSALPGDPRLLTIADDAQTLLEGTMDSAIYLLRESSPQFLYSVTDLAGITFLPGSDDALTIDRDGGRATLLQRVRTGSGHMVLAEGLMHLDGDLAVAIDAKTAFVSSVTSTSLWQIELQTREVHEMQLPAAPAMLQRLRSSRRYLLLYQSGQPAWILDAGDAAPSVQFVPANTGDFE